MRKVVSDACLIIAQSAAHRAESSPRFGQTAVDRARHNVPRQTTPWTGAAVPKCETLLRHNGPPANTPLNKRLMTSVRSGRRVPASARRPSRHSAHDHELKPRALARPMNANVSMLGMEERRWGQHDARPALPRRSQRAHAGTGPPRHSTTLPMDAPPPVRPTLSFFAGRRNRPDSFRQQSGTIQSFFHFSSPARFGVGKEAKEGACA